MSLFKKVVGVDADFITALTCRLLGHITHDEYLKPIYLQQVEYEVKRLNTSQTMIMHAKNLYLDSRVSLTKEIEYQLSDLQTDDKTKENILEAGWRIIWVDKYLGLKEYQAIHLCGFWLGFTRDTIDKIGDRYKPKYISIEHQKAMALLGVTEHSSLVMVKKAYKNLLKAYHPDKVIGEGGDIDRITEATVLTIKINEAYELIRHLHNFNK